MSRATLSKIEKGGEGASFGNYAKVLLILGMIHRLVELVDPKFDELGLGLAEENLPKRIRIPRSERGRNESIKRFFLILIINLEC